MSDYGSAGPQGSYGPPGASGPAASRPPSDPAQFVTITSYAAGALGVLGFIWGFLDWQTSGDQGSAGFEGIGAAAVGLTLAAGLIASAAVLEKRDTTLAPAAVAAAALSRMPPFAGPMTAPTRPMLSAQPPPVARFGVG